MYQKISKAVESLPLGCNNHDWQGGSRTREEFTQKGNKALQRTCRKEEFLNVRKQPVGPRALEPSQEAKTKEASGWIQTEVDKTRKIQYSLRTCQGRQMLKIYRCVLRFDYGHCLLVHMLTGPKVQSQSGWIQTVVDKTRKIQYSLRTCQGRQML